MPAVTGHDEAFAFLPLLTSSLLTKIGIIYTAGGKDLSIDAQIRMIGLKEPEICTKMLKKMSEKTQSKISCHYTWLLHGKNWSPRWHFLRSFFNHKQAQ